MVYIKANNASVGLQSLLDQNGCNTTEHRNSIEEMAVLIPYLHVILHL